MGGATPEDIQNGLIALQKSGANISDPAVLDAHGICNATLCPIGYSNFHYEPSKAVNIALVALFVISMLANVVQGFIYKKWSFMVCMLLGGLTEVIGYAARVMASTNAWNRNAFLVQIITLTIAPIFYTAAIYICFTQIIAVFGYEYSRITPRMYYWIFCSCDFIALVLQGGGGGMAATANTKSQSDNGTHIMLGGLIFQVISLLIFLCLAFEYGWTFMKRTAHRELPASLQALKHSRRFQCFITGMLCSTILIIIRSVYRAAEMAGGWDGSLMADEVTFVVFESIFVIIAALILNIFHIGEGLRKADAVYRKSLDAQSEAGMEMMNHH